MNKKIYTSQFWLLCISSLLFFGSFNMVIPSMPAYLTTLGGAEYKGLIIGLFTVTAMLSRPFSGKLADKIGRIPIIMVGSIVCIICSLIYPVVATVTGLLFLRFVHGFSTGFTPTGQTAYVSDIIPADRRGEAMGILGTASTVGMAGGAALGGFLEKYQGLNFMFYCSSAFAIIAILILIGLRETLPRKQRFSPGMLKINKEDLFEPRVWAPCVVMVLAAYAYGGVITLIPDFSEYVGIHNKGLLLTYFTIASLAVRLMGGKASDRWGRKPVLLVSVSVLAFSMLLIATAATKTYLIVGIVLYGFAQGTTSPTLLAWATDLSSSIHKGRGVASLYIFMELGIGLGALVSAAVYNNKYDNFFITFVVCSSLAVVAVLYLLIEKSSRKVLGQFQ